MYLTVYTWLTPDVCEHRRKHPIVTAHFTTANFLAGATLKENTILVLSFRDHLIYSYRRYI